MGLEAPASTTVLLVDEKSRSNARFSPAACAHCSLRIRWFYTSKWNV